MEGRHATYLIIFSSTKNRTDSQKKGLFKPPAEAQAEPQTFMKNGRNFYFEKIFVLPEKDICFSLRISILFMILWVDDVANFFFRWNANRCQVFTTFPTPTLVQSRISIICNVGIEVEQDRKKIPTYRVYNKIMKLKGYTFCWVRGYFSIFASRSTKIRPPRGG